jgi:hypothetical protein
VVAYVEVSIFDGMNIMAGYDVERPTLNASMLSETLLTASRRVKEGIYVTKALLLDVPITRIRLEA